MSNNSEEHHEAQPTSPSNLSTQNKTSRFGAASQPATNAIISTQLMRGSPRENKENPYSQPMIRSPRSQKSSQRSKNEKNDSQRYSNKGASPDNSGK